MVLCFAADCNHQTVRNKCSFFRFPKDNRNFKLWTMLSRRADRAPGSDARLCSCHFEDGNKLKGPSIFNRSLSSNGQFKQRIKISSPPLNFPNDNQKRAQWTEAGQRENWSSSESNKLCSEYFPDEMNDRTSVSCVRLREHVVASIFETVPSSSNVEEIKVEREWEEDTDSHISETATRNSLLKEIDIKVEERWEESTNNSASDTGTGTSVSNQLKIQDVRSLLSTENTGSSLSQKEVNMEKKRISTNVIQNMDIAVSRKNLKTDKREEIFGRFIACELNALRGNRELYLKTKQSILNVFMEVNYKQMNLNPQTS